MRNSTVPRRRGRLSLELPAPPLLRPRSRDCRQNSVQHKDIRSRGYSFQMRISPETGLSWPGSKQLCPAGLKGGRGRHVGVKEESSTSLPLIILLIISALMRQKLKGTSLFSRLCLNVTPPLGLHLPNLVF